MRIAQHGDHVQVHYVKRFQDGSVASSRGRSPLEVIIGVDHPRLPGLGMALVGLAAGESTTLKVPPERAYGFCDPGRVRRVNRQRFRSDPALDVGKWVHVKGRRRQRLVRIVEVRENTVVVDTNHRWAGQTLELQVQLISIHGGDARAGSSKWEGPASGLTDLI